MLPPHLGVHQRHWQSRPASGEWKPAFLDVLTSTFDHHIHHQTYRLRFFPFSIVRFPLIILIPHTMTDVQHPFEPAGHWMPLTI